jgi:hypothetical protein
VYYPGIQSSEIQSQKVRYIVLRKWVIDKTVSSLGTKREGDETARGRNGKGTKRQGDETARGRNGKGTKQPGTKRSGTKRQGDETTSYRTHAYEAKIFQMEQRNLNHALGFHLAPF